MEGVTDEMQAVYDGVCAAIGRAVIEVDKLGYPISKELIIGTLERHGEKEGDGERRKFIDIAIRRMGEGNR